MSVHDLSCKLISERNILCTCLTFITTASNSRLWWTFRAASLLSGHIVTVKHYRLRNYSCIWYILYGPLSFPWSDDHASHVLSRSVILTWCPRCGGGDIIHWAGIYGRKEGGFDRASLERSPRWDVLMSSTSWLFPSSSLSLFPIKQYGKRLKLHVRAYVCVRREGKI